MVAYRIETDSMGKIEVPSDKLWGAQTQRSLENFDIGIEKFIHYPEFIQALGIIKRACAEVNQELSFLPSELATPIIKAAQEVIEGKLDTHFPLVIWQTGSGTQTNMNANETIANRAIQILGGTIGSKNPIHPNDHVNLSQSSNDVIPTAMHIAAVDQIHSKFIPALLYLAESLEAKSNDFISIVKTGRTHLQDATPVTLGQEFGAYAHQIRNGITRVKSTLPHLYELAIGGTAVGTGLNTHPKFAERVVTRISEITGYPFITGRNKFEGLAAHDAIVETSGALKVVAVSMMKIANDIRWLGSGPRTGLSELLLPANEPGSSMMPGKVNPTQAEAVTQVVAQVLGNDVTIAFAGSQGNFELNVFKPVMIYNLLQSIHLLTDVVISFTDKCISGLKANLQKIKEDLEKNLMLVTRLTPVIGYDMSANIAHEAYKTCRTLKEVIRERKILSEKELEEALNPSEMLSPNL